MKNDQLFLRCEKCGNILNMIEHSGVTPFCCGEKMTVLQPNTVDAAQEKHVPIGKRDGAKLSVTVGAAIHPMTGEHHIGWIAASQGKVTQRVNLEHTGEPAATFFFENPESITIYAYCNLHGLWAAEV